MKPHDRTECYLCGVLLSKTNRTKDHVPPKSLFPQPYPDNLLTVPCCQSCNNGKSSEEEFFRLIASLGLHQTPEKAALYKRVVEGTLKRGRLRREITELVAKMRHNWMEVNGLMMPIAHASIPDPPLKRITERIARGLIAHFHPELAVHKLSCHTSIFKKWGHLLEQLAFFDGDLQELRLGGRVFHAYHGCVQDNPGAGVWIMIFHETVASMVTYFDEAAQRLIDGESSPDSGPSSIIGS